MNKDNILIVCALEQETQGELNDWEPFTDNPVWDVIYTGVGKINATMKLVDRLTDYNYVRPELVINYGTAGSRKYEQGEVVDCTRFIQRDMDVTGLGFKLSQTPFEEDIPIIIQSESDFNPIGKNALCGSGDSFMKGLPYAWYKNQIGDVVDMEGYALAKVCRSYSIPFISFKYITDGADGDADIDWEKNVGKGIVKFKEKVLDKLKYSS
jgi:adenosylhomocysteine nucleosidase